MPPKRKTFVRHNVPGTARFLTFSTFRRVPLFADEFLCEKFVARLISTTAARQIHTLAWILMPDHVHLVLFPEDANAITPFLTSLKGTFATEAVKHLPGTPIDDGLRDRAGHSRIWEAGGGFDRCVIGGELLEKIAYVHANPIRRGLAATSVDWKWSSARAYEHRDDYVGPPIAFDLLPPTNRPLT